MNATKTQRDSSQPTEVWSVLVLYDDAATRQQALKVCDHLVQNFWSGIEFEFHWWRTDFLEEAAMAGTAAEDALSSDFIVVCSSPEREFSPSVKNWFDSWVVRRSGREGALIDLTEAGTPAGQHGQRKKNYLRHLARQAMLDYLTRLPPVAFGPLPDSYECAATRAAQITSVLDGILLHEPPPQLPLRP